jgi:preprotein translocase subunit SecG
MSIFGIFATIVTFSGIEISILKNAKSINELIGLTLIMLGSFMVFAFLLSRLNSMPVKIKVGEILNFETYKNLEIDLKSFFWIFIIFLVFILGFNFSNKDFQNEESIQKSKKYYIIKNK